MSLNIANCTRCGRVFPKGLKSECPACLREIDQQYDLCYKYLRDHRQCTLQELSDETGVSMVQITKFIREGRISFQSNPNIQYPCEGCGTPIRQGVYCSHCQSKLSKDLGQQIQATKIQQEDISRSKPRGGFQIRDSE